MKPIRELVRLNPRWSTVLVFCFLGALYAYWYVHPPFLDRERGRVHGDGHYTYLWARSLAFDGDLNLENDYALCGNIFPWRSSAPLEPGLWPTNEWSMGPVVAWTPLLLLARAFIEPPKAAPEPLRRGCYGPLADFALFGSVLMGLGALWFGFRCAHRYVTRAPALFGVVAVGTATALPFYACYFPSYGHAGSAFAAAAFIDGWDQGRGNETTRRWALLGGLLGLAMLMRPELALLGLLPLAEWLPPLFVSLRERNWRRALHLFLGGVLLGGTAILVFSPQAYAWKRMYGEWLVTPQGREFMRWSRASIEGVLFASSNGLLVWTPILYGAFFGIVLGALAPSTRILSAAFAAILAGSLWIHGAAWDYWGSVGFSNRRLTSMALIFVVSLAWSFSALLRFARRHSQAFANLALTGMIALFACWNAVGMWGVGSHRIASSEPQPAPTFWSEQARILSEALWNAVGNPLAWPGALPFSLRYRTHPKSYDVMQGEVLYYRNYFAKEPNACCFPVTFARPDHQLFLAEGFAKGAQAVEGRLAALTTRSRARMLLPFFESKEGALLVRWTASRGTDHSTLQPKAHLAWNGRFIGTFAVPDHWSVERIALPPGTVRAGINELSWRLQAEVAFESLEISK